MALETEKYISLVSFISKALGPDYEISLIDTTTEKNQIISMKYGEISSREKSDRMFPLAQKILDEEEYKTSDYIINRITKAQNGKVLRTSMFFIKDEDKNLQGIISVNFDDERFQELHSRLMHIIHPDHYFQIVTQSRTFNNLLIPIEEVEYKNEQEEKITMEDTVELIVEKELSTITIPMDRLTQGEKVEIIKNLDDIGVFMMKGAVNVIAKKLNTSQASVYRYINMAREEE